MLGSRRPAGWARPSAVAALTALILVGNSPSVVAHPIKSFWQYDKSLHEHGWPKHQALKEKHHQYHEDHPQWDQTPGRMKQHARFHHRTLVHLHRKFHFHKVLGKQEGEASWYQANGETGACGVPLTGKYAAHPTWKCGSLVSVRMGDDYVFVKIKDRGPTGGRVIDLSKRAFKKLASPSTGVIDVRIYRLEKDSPL
jgi:rare lipoprotein A (peptidoglycan hydrolase)